MKTYTKSGLDWYGSALGFTYEEINAVYAVSAFLMHTISQNIPGAKYDPIAYRHGDLGVICIGEITYDGDVINVEFEPGKNPAEGIRNFMNAWLAVIGSDFKVTTMSEIDEAIRVIQEA